MREFKQSIDLQLKDIFERNNPAELAAVMTLLSQFDGRPKDTWLQKIYPFEMAFSGDTGTLKVSRTELMDNSLGILHGGIVMLMADTLMGTLCNEVVPAGKRVVTHEMTTYFTKKGTGAVISARADIIKKGSTTYLVTCQVFNDDDLISFATGSFFLIDLPPAR
ncbi:PaaI family thioesterase [Macrococcus equipercicus]|uniref:PaaI family thioesterase n=1 Tax=Macrococcus equipercicus TaxID=69967 RepID=A0A9Q9BU88_9STAP|nr:PaaI family thioesterase [Macrococcus equipercicus]UTH14559.1 PaaI family thioesterase [Macrococcus equipercicus]